MATREVSPKASPPGSPSLSEKSEREEKKAAIVAAVSVTAHVIGRQEACSSGFVGTPESRRRVARKVVYHKGLRTESQRPATPPPEGLLCEPPGTDEDPGASVEAAPKQTWSWWNYWGGSSTPETEVVDPDLNVKILGKGTAQEALLVVRGDERFVIRRNRESEGSEASHIVNTLASDVAKILGLEGSVAETCYIDLKDSTGSIPAEVREKIGAPDQLATIQQEEITDAVTLEDYLGKDTDERVPIKFSALIRHFCAAIVLGPPDGHGGNMLVTETSAECESRGGSSSSAATKRSAGELVFVDNKQVFPHGGFPAKGITHLPTGEPRILAPFRFFPLGLKESYQPLLTEDFARIERYVGQIDAKEQDVRTHLTSPLVISNTSKLPKTVWNVDKVLASMQERITRLRTWVEQVKKEPDSSERTLCGMVKAVYPEYRLLFAMTALCDCERYLDRILSVQKLEASVLYQMVFEKLQFLMKETLGSSPILAAASAAYKISSRLHAYVKKLIQETLEEDLKGRKMEDFVSEHVIAFFQKRIRCKEFMPFIEEILCQVVAEMIPHIILKQDTSDAKEDRLRLNLTHGENYCREVCKLLTPDSSYKPPEVSLRINRACSSAGATASSKGKGKRKRADNSAHEVFYAIEEHFSEAQEARVKNLEAQLVFEVIREGYATVGKRTVNQLVSWEHGVSPNTLKALTGREDFSDEKLVLELAKLREVGEFLKRVLNTSLLKDVRRQGAFIRHVAEERRRQPPKRFFQKFLRPLCRYVGVSPEVLRGQHIACGENHNAFAEYFFRLVLRGEAIRELNGIFEGYVKKDQTEEAALSRVTRLWNKLPQFINPEGMLEFFLNPWVASIDADPDELRVYFKHKLKTGRYPDAQGFYRDLVTIYTRKKRTPRLNVPTFDSQSRRFMKEEIVRKSVIDLKGVSLPTLRGHLFQDFKRLLQLNGIEIYACGSEPKPSVGPQKQCVGYDDARKRFYYKRKDASGYPTIVPLQVIFTGFVRFEGQVMRIKDFVKLFYPS